MQNRLHINVQTLQVGNDRGIVMSAGGEYYLPQAVVLLRILRHHLRSTLPVELFWYGDEEMDVETLQVWLAASRLLVTACCCCCCGLWLRVAACARSGQLLECVHRLTELGICRSADVQSYTTCAPYECLLKGCNGLVVKARRERRWSLYPADCLQPATSSIATFPVLAA